MLVETKNKEFLFEDDRPFRSCHASTLIVLNRDNVLAAWFGGSEEGADDVGIWAAFRSNGVWSEPRQLAGDGSEPLWNPVLYRGADGVIALYYKAGKKIRSWRTMIMTSADEGKTWTSPKELVPGDAGGRGPVKNKPIPLFGGMLAAPASIETKERWDAFADLSPDGGASWQRSETVPLRRVTLPPSGEASSDKNAVTHKGVIQPTLWESSPGQVHMILRSTESSIFRSDSMDGGRTWCEAYVTGLPNNNSGIDLAQLDDGLLALVYNPVSGRHGDRTPLVIRFSNDNGLSWEQEVVLEDEPGEYSYPAIVACGGELHLTYTWRRERIAYWRLTLNRKES